MAPQRQSRLSRPVTLSAIYAEYIMRNAGLEETQVGIKISRRNINNLRYADDTSLMAESEEELKSLLMKVKVESEKVCLKLNIHSPWVGPGKPNLPLGLRGKAGGRARVTAGPKRPHLGVCPGT